MATKRNKASGENSIDEFGLNISGWKFKVLAAVSFVALTGFGGIVGREYERWRSSSGEQAITALEAAKAYDQLGDVPRRAGEYISTKREGSKDDVRAVARLLRSMMFEIESDRYSVAHFQQAIGGRAKFWSKAFGILAAKKSPAATDFSAGELVMFGRLSDDLASLMTLYGKDFESESVDNAAAAQDRRILEKYR